MLHKAIEREQVNYIFENNIIPKPWSRGDIKESDLKSKFTSLINTMKYNNFTEKEITNLRYSEAFHNLYIGFHKEIESGKGVILFNNTVFKNSNLESKKRIFLKICQFFGKPVSIDKAGTLVKEVKDVGLKDSVNNPVRGHMTNQELAFHSDRADISALLCESNASEGGEFKISSSAKLFNILSYFPEILEELSKDIPHDMRNDGDGQQLCYHPIISYKKTFVVRYIRRFIESVARHNIKLNLKLKNALDFVDKIMSNKHFYHEIIFKPGDIIFFNNHITLHGRNSFVNDMNTNRCLLRIWMSSKFTRELPASFEPIFHSVLPSTHRGGILLN